MPVTVALLMINSNIIQFWICKIFQILGFNSILFYYSNGKLISKLGKISKQLNNNKMPPKKYLGNNPDKKLTVEESKLIIDWATEQADILAGE